jgi:hypothetical protein
VTTLKFHRDLYAGQSVDEAIKAFASHAELTPREEGNYWVVEVRAGSPAMQRRVALELGNYALGLTVRRGTR